MMPVFGKPVLEIVAGRHYFIGIKLTRTDASARTGRQSTGWYQHITLSILASALLTVMRSKGRYGETAHGNHQPGSRA